MVIMNCVVKSGVVESVEQGKPPLEFRKLGFDVIPGGTHADGLTASPTQARRVPSRTPILAPTVFLALALSLHSFLFFYS
ncbi:hypothetical protein JB92DRAFT_1121134 [Gautieria morchelliformis]|nr:hypothetical protein JB92DRAFT_1121134 [Gautieria morchelliformis]